MKEKVSKFLNWGVGAFSIIMKNKLVIIGCMLFQGIIHMLDPRGSLRWSAGMLSIFVALYAAISIIFILTDKNETVGKGKKIAGDLVLETIKGNKEPAMQSQELTSIDKVIEQKTKESNDRWDERMRILAENQTKESKVPEIVMLIFYIIVLIGAVVLFFQSDITIGAIHVIIGLMLIVDGVSTIASINTARKNGLPMKDEKLNFVVSLISIAVGFAFIIFCRASADMAMRISGIILTAKGVTDLIILLRNRQLVFSIKETLRQIKEHEASSMEANSMEVSEASNKE